MSINEEWGEGIKFIWKIENFGRRNEFLSTFFGTTLQTAWKVKFRNSYKENFIDILVEKWKPVFHEINCSVALLDTNGNSLIRKEKKATEHIKLITFSEFIEISKLNSKEIKFLPNDTLTVEFHVWRTPNWLLSWLFYPPPMLCFSHVRVQNTIKVVKKGSSGMLVAYVPFIRISLFTTVNNYVILGNRFYITGLYISN